ESTEYSDADLSNWTGGAADAYAERKEFQLKAIEAFCLNADAARKWLVDIAEENIAYVVKLADLLSQAVGDVAQATIDAGGVSTIPWAIDNLSGAVGTLVTGALQQLGEIAKRIMKAVRHQMDLYSITSDRKVFGANQEWPEAVTI